MEWIVIILAIAFVWWRSRKAKHKKSAERLGFLEREARLSYDPDRQRYFRFWIDDHKKGENNRFSFGSVSAAKMALEDVIFCQDYDRKRADGLGMSSQLYDAYIRGISNIIYAMEGPARAREAQQQEEAERIRQDAEAQRAQEKDAKTLRNRLATLTEAGRALKPGHDNGMMVNTIDGELAALEHADVPAHIDELGEQLDETLRFVRKRAEAAGVDDDVLFGRLRRLQQQLAAAEAASRPPLQLASPQPLPASQRSIASQ